MSFLTAIFQAVGQALTWIFPVSESGHSAIFHNFSGRFTDACSQLTGVIHIGIAIGLFAAFFKVFIALFKNFFGTWGDIFHKNLDLKNVKPSRNFMYMTILSFVPMILYFIPVGKGENIYSLIHSVTYNITLLDEGAFFVVTASLLILAATYGGKIKKPLPPAAQSIIIGVAVFFALPLGGLSLTGIILCLCMLTGLSDRNSLRYSAVMSVVILLITGIIELCTAVTDVGIAAAIIAIIISAVSAFFSARLMSFVLKKRLLNYFGIYNAVVGLVCIVIGSFQLIVK